MPRGEGTVRWAWVPGAGLFLLGATLLVQHGVTAGQVARYAGWLVFGIVVPGTLILRALRGTPRSFVEDIAAGTALGFALEILVYIGLRALNAPMLIVAWPVGVIAVFAFFPELRRHWRSGGERTPVGWAWAVCGCIAIIMLWMAADFFDTHPLTGSLSGLPYVDLPYHLTLAGEVKHHVPPAVPYVLGQPLHHHWFAHADMAASSWATGLEMRLILLRLQLFPFIAATVSLTALLASRITRRWWPGPIAVVVAYFVSALSPYLWVSGTLFFDERLLNSFQWQSPSHLVGAALFAPVPLLITDRLRKEGAATGQWILITILLAAAMGAKSTLLPLFLAGAGLVGLVHLIVRRRLQPVAVIGGVIGGALFLFASFVLYGGGAYGLMLKPLGYIRQQHLVTDLHLAPHGIDAVPTGPVLAIAGLALASWMARATGMAGLLVGRNRTRDPSTLFLGGIVLAALAMVFLYVHPGSSQVYFMRSAFPFIGVLAACGIAAQVPSNRRVGPILIALWLAAEIGALAAALAAANTAIPPFTEVIGSRSAVLVQILKPMLAVVAVMVQIAVVLGLLRRRVRWLRGITAALVLAAVTGTGLPATVRDLMDIDNRAKRHALLKPRVPVTPRPIPEEGVQAARWLRDHSGPSDVVATNTHCRTVFEGRCDNRHFWVSAYTERRVLVEGWGYTPYSIGGGRDGKETFFYSLFPDQQLLAENDAAFRTPSADTVGRLRDAYGVRWLFVDQRYDSPAAGLEEFAVLRYRVGSCAVYELRASLVGSSGA